MHVIQPAAVRPRTSSALETRNGSHHVHLGFRTRRNTVLDSWSRRRLARRCVVVGTQRTPPWRRGSANASEDLSGRPGRSGRARWRGLGRASFCPFVQNEIRNGGVSSVKVWDIDIKTLSREQRQATVVFKVKARGSQVMDPGVYNCRAEFVLDPDNQWRLKTFTLFLPQTDPMKGEPLPLPIG